MNTLTKTTHVAKIKQANQSQIGEVCELLNWSEDQYCNYQFEQYTAFVKQMFWGYPIELYKNALYSPVMRGFWNNEAFKRNQGDFIPYATEETNPLLCLLEDFEGVFYLEACQKGAAHMVEEFMFIHHHKRLINDDAFMHQYYQTLKLIK